MSDGDPRGTAAALHTLVDAPPLGAQPRMLPTVVLEGESLCPAGVAIQDYRGPEGPVVDVSLSRVASRRTIALAALAFALWLAAVASLWALPTSAVGGVILAALLLGVVPFVLFQRSRARFRLHVTPTLLFAQSLHGRGAMLLPLRTADVQGFGYQRAAGSRWRWQLVVVLRSGLTLPVDLPCWRRDEARFVARRFNAALAELQRAG